MDRIPSNLVQVGNEFANFIIDANCQHQMGGLGGCPIYDINKFPAKYRHLIEAYINGEQPESIVLTVIAMEVEAGNLSNELHLDPMLEEAAVEISRLLIEVAMVRNNPQCIGLDLTGIPEEYHGLLNAYFHDKEMPAAEVIYLAVKNREKKLFWKGYKNAIS